MELFYPCLSVGFRGPKSKKRYGGIVLDDTDVSGRRSKTTKEGKEVARVWCAMWHGVTVPHSTVVPRSQFGSGLP